MTYAKAVVERFARRRGLALGVMATGLGLAGLSLPPEIATVIAAGTWRDAYLTLALLTLAAATTVRGGAIRAIRSS